MAVNFILVCLLVYVALTALESTTGLPIIFNSTCNVTINRETITLKSLPINKTIVDNPNFRGACLQDVSGNRLICVLPGKVTDSNDCISYQDPPLNTWCQGNVKSLDLSQKLKDGSLLYSFTMNRGSSCSMILKMVLAITGIHSFETELCHYECKLTENSSEVTPVVQPTTCPLAKPGNKTNTTENSSQQPDKSDKSDNTTSAKEKKSSYTKTIMIVTIPIAGLTLVVVVILLCKCKYASYARRYFGRPFQMLQSSVSKKAQHDHETQVPARNETSTAV